MSVWGSIPLLSVNDCQTFESLRLRLLLSYSHVMKGFGFTVENEFILELADGNYASPGDLLVLSPRAREDLRSVPYEGPVLFLGLQHGVECRILMQDGHDWLFNLNDFLLVSSL